MKTLSSFRIAATAIIAFISLVAASEAFSQGNIYEKVVPRFAEREDVEMRYLATEAYESLAGVQLVSQQTRSLAEECMDGIVSVVILSSTSQPASSIGLSEFESFRKKNPDMRLLMRTRQAHTERSSWLLPKKDGKPSQMIIVVRDAQTLMIAIMEGGDGDSDNTSYRRSNQFDWQDNVIVITQ